MIVLLRGDASVGRAKKIRLNQLVSPFYIVVIFLIVGVPALYVMIGMITHAMTPFQYFIKKFRMLLNILPNAKESRLCIILIQKLQNLRRNLFNGTIIKSYI